MTPFPIWCTYSRALRDFTCGVCRWLIWSLSTRGSLSASIKEIKVRIPRKKNKLTCNQVDTKQDKKKHLLPKQNFSLPSSSIAHFQFECTPLYFFQKPFINISSFNTFTSHKSRQVTAMRNQLFSSASIFAFSVFENAILIFYSDNSTLYAKQILPLVLIKVIWKESNLLHFFFQV